MTVTPVTSPVSSKQRQFDALVRTLSGDLYRYAYWLCRDNALAQDLVQETFLRAWRSIDSLRESDAAKAWLITILRREHARLYERKTPQVSDISEIDVQDESGMTPERAGESGMIRAAMLQLEPKYREPLLMQVLGGFSCDEIARELNLSGAAVMTQLFRARQKLKAVLLGKDEAELYELP
ncbi:sigma-70 family RNA polymerase sigma factor [Pseudolysobacter antarcticus]|uniref:RNA polymerase sigma factor n=1 Tax=Pseudolysobacter antarcticus TaxID=2511995 RepID=A0A411HP73_9GAMM|nr:sigma-70 family RNA polymerase sigma factor [Pseudolysobacter antarcticus]QBB72262.1 sigma-70 family RNA polymerase sigma factor [Pseudolysobacter antarcticus]